MNNLTHEVCFTQLQHAHSIYSNSDYCEFPISYSATYIRTVAEKYGIISWIKHFSVDLTALLRSF
jgi:hypothetical protein